MCNIRTQVKLLTSCKICSDTDTFIHFSLSHRILFKICFNTTLLYTKYFPSGVFPSGIPIKILCSLMFLPIRATRPAQLILLELFNILGGNLRQRPA